MNAFAVVGSWSWEKNAAKGLHVFRYLPQTGDLAFVESGFPEVTVGQQTFSRETNTLYALNELRDLDGRVGGGGYVMALAMDADTGRLTLKNRVPSLSPQPCYVCLDKTGRYALVANHGTRNYVTRIVGDGMGGYTPVTLFDDVAVSVLRLRGDGSLGEAGGAFVIPCEEDRGFDAIPHPHSIVADPGGDMYVVCDKGLDRVYAFRLNRDNGKLELLDTLRVADGLAPRYTAFHPMLPIVYCNNENLPSVHTVAYDAQKGALRALALTQALEKNADGTPPQGSCSDIIASPDGKALYVSIRKANVVSVFSIDEAGGLALRQSIPCGGDNPRGLCLAPDGRFLFVANVVTGNVARFAVLPGGMLYAQGECAHAPCAGNMQIITPGSR